MKGVVKRRGRRRDPHRRGWRPGFTPELAEAVWDAESDPLSDRERAVLSMAEEGRSNRDKGLALELLPGTVRIYLSKAARKLGAANRTKPAGSRGPMAGCEPISGGSSP